MEEISATIFSLKIKFAKQKIKKYNFLVFMIYIKEKKRRRMDKS